MFLNTGNLNEGGCRDICSESRKMELKEGENPKSCKGDWHSARSSSHANITWQQLRK